MRLALFGLQLQMFEDDVANVDSAGESASKYAVRKTREFKTYEAEVR